MKSKLKQATLGAGCFWCVEAVFQNIHGVHHVEAGYAGGDIRNPTYREVCSGLTGHAEVVRIHYDPDVVGYEELLDVFWHTHDPTSPNRQGADVGQQYRSVIFYHDEDQRRIAETSLVRIDASDIWVDPIITEISPLKNYSTAEDYHQNYYNNNPSQPYCSVVIAPKLKKLRSSFSQLLKES